MGFIHFIITLILFPISFFSLIPLSTSGNFSSPKRFGDHYCNKDSSFMNSIDVISDYTTGGESVYSWISLLLSLTMIGFELFIDICHYKKIVFSIGFLDSFIQYSWNNQWTFMSIISHFGPFAQIGFWILFVLAIMIVCPLVF